MKKTGEEVLHSAVSKKRIRFFLPNMALFPLHHTGERPAQWRQYPFNFVSEAAYVASLRHITYHKVSQSTGLPDSRADMMRRQEEKLGRAGRCRFGESNQSKQHLGGWREKKTTACRSVSAGHPSRHHYPLPTPLRPPSLYLVIT